jgi:hypothetical protein
VRPATVARMTCGVDVRVTEPRVPVRLPASGHSTSALLADVQPGTPLFSSLAAATVASRYTCCTSVSSARNRLRSVLVTVIREAHMPNGTRHPGPCLQGPIDPKGSGSPSARFRKRASTSIWCRRLGHQLGLPPTTGLLSPTSPCSRSSWRPWAHRIDGVTGRGAAGACPVQHRRLQSSCGSVGTNRRAATECAWRICVSG